MKNYRGSPKKKKGPGRVVDQRWTKANTDLDRFKYGYDRDSNRLFKQNVLDAVFSELYHQSGAAEGYDPLNQLTGFERGVLFDSDFDGIYDTTTSTTRQQVWAFDALGNWTSLTTDGATQNRTHNLQNEVTSVNGASLTFDANGNTTTDETGRHLVYDAWNRLVEVKSPGGATLVRYGYDAQNRRVKEIVGGVTRDLYYSDQWQVLEERVNGVTQVQYVWSPVYVDAMILRDRDTNANGTLDERLYVLQDANWNVTALVNTSGQVMERYVYAPYGQATVLAPNWLARASSLFRWQYLHQGGRFDAASGLYHFRNRDYSPTLGRWIQVDPIAINSGFTNLYLYVANGPVNGVDPTGFLGGLCACSGQNCKWSGKASFWFVASAPISLSGRISIIATGIDDTGCTYAINARGSSAQVLSGGTFGAGYLSGQIEFADKAGSCMWPVEVGQNASVGIVGAGFSLPFVSWFINNMATWAIINVGAFELGSPWYGFGLQGTGGILGGGGAVLRIDNVVKVGPTAP